MLFNIIISEIGEPEKAEGFLLDVIKMYKTEGWEMLADEVRLDLAKCQESLQRTYKFVKTLSRVCLIEFHCSLK